MVDTRACAYACPPVQTNFASAGNEELAASASAAVCAGAQLATCTVTTVSGDRAGDSEAKHAFISADGSVLVDAAGALEVLGALEDGVVVDHAAAVVATVADMKTVCTADMPADTLRKIAEHGASVRVPVACACRLLVYRARTHCLARTHVRRAVIEDGCTPGFCGNPEPVCTSLISSCEFTARGSSATLLS